MTNPFSRFWQWLDGRRVQQITYENALERVRRGAAYLDEVDPEWYRRVDPVTLELADGRHCILGQLHGDFRLGLGRSQLINLSSGPRASLSPVAYGFKCVSGIRAEAQDRDYRYLNRAWQAAVHRRQRADEQPATAQRATGRLRAEPEIGDGHPAAHPPVLVVSSRSTESG